MKMYYGQTRWRSHLSWNISYILMIFLLTIPHLKPDYFNSIPIMDSIFNAFRILSFVILAIRYFFFYRRISKIIIVLFLLELFLLGNTALHNGNTYNSLLDVFPTVSICMLYDMVDKKRIVSFVSVQLFCLELLIYINFLTILLFPEGLYTAYYTYNFFLGYYNTLDKYFLPALMFAFLYKEMTGKKARAYVLTAIIFASGILVWSGGILIALAGVAIVYCFFKEKTVIFNYYSYWLMHIVFFLFVILLHTQDTLRWVIQDVLGKWNSLEGRMLVWQIELKRFMDSPIVGYGVEDSSVRMGQNGWASHAHNLLLEILHRGGLVYLTLFICIIILAGRKMMKNKNTEVVKIISVVMLGWCLHTLVEPMMGALYMGLFVIAYHCEDYIKICRCNS